MASEQLTERARSEATVDTGGSPVDAGAPSVATHGALGSVHQAAARLRGLSPHEREAEIGALQSQRGNAFTGNVLAALDDPSGGTAGTAVADEVSAPTRLEFESLVDLGDVELLAQRVLPIYVYNRGLQPVHIARVATTVSNNYRASIDDKEQGDIEPGDYAVVRLEFTARTLGVDAGLVKITTDTGETFDIVVRASGTPWAPPAPAADPTHAAEPPAAPAVPERAPSPVPAPVIDPTPAPVAPVAQPLRILSDKLHFNGVVGRPLLPQWLGVASPNESRVAVDVSIEGGDGSFTAPSDLSVEPESKNAPRAQLPIAFMPLRPGTVRGHLVLRYGQHEQRVELEGEAIQVPGTAAEDAARDPSGPVPIEDLPDANASRTAAQKRALRDRAADAVSTLPMNYQSLVPHADAAVEHFGEQIVRAGSTLNQRIVTWLTQEGLSALGSLRADRDAEVAKFLTAEAVDAVADQHPISMAVSKVLQLGLTAYEAEQAVAEADGHIANVGAVSGIAGRGGDVATRALMKQYGALLQEYGAAREALTRVASYDVQTGLAAATEADSQAFYELSKGTVRQYRAAHDRLAESVRSIAAAGISAQNGVDVGFRRMLDAYLRFRATGVSDGEEVRGRDLQAERRRVRVSGHVNLDTRSRHGDPMNIVFSRVAFGRYDVNEMSATMLEHADGKTLAELHGWDVEIRLVLAHNSEEVVLRQDAAGTRTARSSDGRVEEVGGVAALWHTMEGKPLRAF
jgi:hypothetical protein